MQVQSLVWDDPLAERMATHFSILAWRIPWTGAWQAMVHRATKSQTGLRIHTHYSNLYIGMHQSLPPCVAISFLALM